MDPLMHLALPVLLLLALRFEPRRVLVFAPLAVVPDLDALWLHRAVLHNVFVTVALPLAFIAYSKLRRPEWLMGALMAQFYLFSHVVLDLGGVSIFWPFVTDMWYFDPSITLTVRGGVDVDFDLEYGWRRYEPMGTSSLLSDYGFAILFLGLLLLVVFRKQACTTLKTYFGIFADALLGFLK
ncbi:MAG: hypothetical protein ACUVT7_01085 [Thermoplasmata archaeon]